MFRGSNHSSLNNARDYEYSLTMKICYPHFAFVLETLAKENSVAQSVKKGI